MDLGDSRLLGQRFALWFGERRDGLPDAHVYVGSVENVAQAWGQEICVLALNSAVVIPAQGPEAKTFDRVAVQRKTLSWFRRIDIAIRRRIWVNIFDPGMLDRDPNEAVLGSGIIRRLP
jgi:hypothetical protein